MSKMLSVKLTTVMTLFSISIASPVLSKADGSTFNCQGEIKNGKLELAYTKKGVSNNTTTTENVAENCRILTIEFTAEEHVGWDLIEKPTMPKLNLLVLRFANPNWTIESKFIRDLDWKSLSVFGHEPEDVARLQYSIWAYLPLHGSILKTYTEIFEFNSVLNTLKISGLDPNPIFKKFKYQNITIRTLSLKNNKLDNNFFPDGIVELNIENVQIQNQTRLIQKLESVEFLSLDLNSIDVGEILRVAKNLTKWDIWNSNLRFSEAEAATIQSKSLKVLLELYDCTLNSSFTKEAWSAMPDLEELRVQLNSTNTKFDIGDLSLNKKLKKLVITNTKVTLTKPHEKFNALTTLKCLGCGFDMTFGVDQRNAFPNLSHVTGFPNGWNDQAK